MVSGARVLRLIFPSAIAAPFGRRRAAMGYEAGLIAERAAVLSSFIGDDSVVRYAPCPAAFAVGSGSRDVKQARVVGEGVWGGRCRRVEHDADGASKLPASNQAGVETDG